MSKPVSADNTPLDEILIKFRLSGRYYIQLLTLISFLYVNDVILCTDYVFTAEKVSYRCLDERFGNDSCASLSNSTEVCTEWVYDEPHSFVAEFQLACQEWKRTLVGTVQSFGYGAGLLMIGPLSDRLGRKNSIVIIGALSATMGVARSFTTSYWSFIIFEFLGSALGNVYSPAYILMIEMVAHEKRVLVKVICSLASALAYFLPALVAWYVPYWRHMLLILFTPGILFISYFFLMDESPRWLLSRGRKDEAIAILEKAARRSNVKLDPNAFDKLACIEDNNVTLIRTLKETFTSKLLVKRFFICLVWWTAGTFVTFGLRINSVLLPGNKYINFVLFGLIAFPARAMLYWLLNAFTRKTTLIGAFFLCALVLFSAPFIPKSQYWLSIVLFLLGKFFGTMFFAVTYIFTSELFPTYTRNTTHALCSSLGRVGSMLAPQTPLLMVYWDGLPSLTFGAAALLAGFVTLLSPSTHNDVLPDNVLEAEAIGNKKQNVKNDNISTIDKSNGFQRRSNVE